MSPDDVDYDGALEEFAYPGEMPELAELARRFVDRDDDFDALTDGLLVLRDGIEAAGYGDGVPVHDLVEGALEDMTSIVAAWRAVRDLPGDEVDRIVALARRGCGGPAEESGAWVQADWSSAARCGRSSTPTNTVCAAARRSPPTAERPNASAPT